jgi:hypothetical protein
MNVSKCGWKRFLVRTGFITTVIDQSELMENGYKISNEFKLD